VVLRWWGGGDGRRDDDDDDDKRNVRSASSSVQSCLGDFFKSSVWPSQAVMIMLEGLMVVFWPS